MLSVSLTTMLMLSLAKMIDWPPKLTTRSSVTAETARDADNVDFVDVNVKRPFRVTLGHPLFCQSTRHI